MARSNRAESTRPRPRDPVLDALERAPIDDEPLSDEERREIEQARKEGFVSDNEARKLLGL